MRALAVIPARGGSKRLPGKNIRKFAGKPMLAWSVEAAHESGLFDTVMVSTDSEEIAEVARAAGASVPFLRSAMATGQTLSPFRLTSRMARSNPPLSASASAWLTVSQVPRRR